MTATVRTCRFGSLTIAFDERVLTPRPWTLLQSEWAAELAGRLPAGPILELCAGAGHIGLAAAVLAQRPLVQVEADDVAARYARANAAAAAVGHDVDVRHAPMQTALAADERFPLVLADPPYLPTADVGIWPDDPVTAIDGGPDGLDLVRMCLQVAGVHLAPGGAVLLQVAGADQAALVHEYLTANPHVGLVARGTRSHDPARAVMLLAPARADLTS